MRLLSTLFRLRVRVRYWKRRALKAEAQAQLLIEQLDAEMWRNRDREDTFVSASIMGQRQMFGVPPRSGPAIPPSAPIKSVNPYPTWDAGLTWADKQEYELEWKPDAERAGVNPQQAQRDFLEKIASRRLSLNDDPYNAN